jgi:hypothetical protein
MEQQLREEVKETGENCKIRSVVSYTVCQHGFDDSVITKTYDEYI